MKPSLREAYRKALPAIVSKASPLQRDVLSILAEAGTVGVSATQLAVLLEQKDKVVINRAFGLLGKALWSVVKSHPDGSTPDEFGWWSMLATGKHQGDEFAWSLRPEVLKAVPAKPSKSRQAAVPSLKSIEGRRLSALTDFYERSATARRLCLKAHGHACAACGVLLAMVYGPIADDFIHVHHLNPLNANGRAHLVDPVRDLRPVCPNCHAVIHITPEPMSVDEVRALLQTRKRKARAATRQPAAGKGT